ncbi:CLUMA_CG013497, isoform A [Clunio marinus]|uniref:CLUMA_CG013497, isoform A n=1 Tax=Clunio marinus TaxID=568069 RepID=A0A1J1IJ02_9DIPT|nr:CLUMA_CG013497, isoform A [Clunio marinus]
MKVFEYKIVQILIAVLIPLVGAALFNIGAQRNMFPWYDTLKRPSWTPPNWLFGPMWTFLYLSMGYASFRVWDKGMRFSGPAKWPLIIYIIHLFINWTWSQVFFGFHLIGGAAIHIVILLLFVITTAIAFARVDLIAGILFIPYIIWGSYATTVAIGFWVLN